MPRVAEIKEINGEIWVKLGDKTPQRNSGEIFLYTRQELDHLIRGAIEAFREKILALKP